MFESCRAHHIRCISISSLNRRCARCSIARRSRRVTSTAVWVAISAASVVRRSCRAFNATSSGAIGSPVALTFACILSGVGCVDPELAALARSLKLEIAQADRVGLSEPVEFVFRLSSRGASVVEACLGPSRSVHYTSSGPQGTRATFVDHPGCEKEFTITPGSEITWQETLEVPHVEGGVEVEVDVEIVNPRWCGGLGCPATQLRSDSYRIP